MLCHGGAIEDAVTMGGPLDVAQPAWSVRVAHQVGVKRDRVIAGITYEQRSLPRRLRVRTSSINLVFKPMKVPALHLCRECTNCSLGLNNGALQRHQRRQCEVNVFYLIWDTEETLP